MAQTTYNCGQLATIDGASHTQLQTIVHNRFNRWRNHVAQKQGTVRVAILRELTRHATLRQKMLVTLPVTFPLTLLTTSEVYSGSLEADMSENHPSCSSATRRTQQRAGCKCTWERFVWKTLQASTVEHSWITLAYGSYPSSIGLSQDMWYHGRRYL